MTVLMRLTWLARNTNLINFVTLSQCWPNSGPPSFDIGPAKVFYITMLICASMIFYVYVKKKKKNKKSKLKKIRYTFSVFDSVSPCRSVFVVTTSFNNINSVIVYGLVFVRARRWWYWSRDEHTVVILLPSGRN